ncbi:UNVERIFIED_CONTAM: hypothetical protein GTU68_049155 [Idotea baltica]|nr:hypothetical protein [Idotea baltica]
MLNVVVHGTGENTPLVIAHGLYGSARNWGVIAKRLSDTRPVIAVDMRNHGTSPWFDSHSYPDLATDLAQVIEANGGRADVLGHSMGGKAAMVLALQNPDLVERLIVADIAPVTYTHSQLPYVQAMRSIDLSGIETRVDADTLLAQSVEDPALRAFLLQSLDVKARGWRLNLKALEDQMPLIMGFPDMQNAFDGPTLFLAGGTSDYVKPQDRAQMKALFPAARFAKIPGAGHWLHAEKPREFEAAVQAFLALG